eukprot:CAMPEP_0179061578 /NCGR_PEP_ID=MMETSP0796-20121207/26478_1 /TAXON_ID=73915 /ORGANISM="Pyrodinium bahamense, Strain pbaha01" /LENGTH=263 /DNA_ID=CAMNT_0020758445 /DNA_START=73 /DNA_END=866 /DNA_ORIENTATION=-
MALAALIALAACGYTAGAAQAFTALSTAAKLAGAAIAVGGMRVARHRGGRASAKTVAMKASGIATNGCGPIGRSVARIAMKNPDAELETHHCLVRCGRSTWPTRCSTTPSMAGMKAPSRPIDGQKAALSRMRDPAAIPCGRAAPPSARGELILTTLVSHAGEKSVSRGLLALLQAISSASTAVHGPVVVGEPHACFSGTLMSRAQTAFDDDRSLRTVIKKPVEQLLAQQQSIFDFVQEMQKKQGRILKEMQESAFPNEGAVVV